MTARETTASGSCPIPRISPGLSRPMSVRARRSWAGSFSIGCRSGMNCGGGSISSRRIIRKARPPSSTHSCPKPVEVRSSCVHQPESFAVRAAPPTDVPPLVPSRPVSLNKGERMSWSAKLLVVVGFLVIIAAAPRAEAAEVISAKPLPPIPLTLDEVLAWVDRAHPLLKGAGTEKIVAKGKMLRALGAFEPTLINDTLIEARHPWGFRGSAGIREVINGPAKIPDLAFNNGNNQVLLGGFIPL